MLLALENVYKSFNGVFLLENVSFTLEKGERAGIIGPNGAGKTTLLRLLLGRLDADRGEIHLSKDMRVGVLDQLTPADPNNTLLEEMRGAFEPLLEAQKEMNLLEKRLEAGEEDESILARYASLQSYFEANEGHLMEVNIAKVLGGLGFPKERWEDSVSALSGGEKTRLALARLLLQAPDLLVLDEPTNHLDFEALHWLEGFLSEYKGAVLAVSHDRFFLDAIAQKIIEVEHKKATVYKGNYTKYLSLRQEAYERQEKEYKAQQQKIVELTDFVNRNIARASTTALARSRQKELEKMELIERPIPPGKAANFTFEPRIQSGKEVLEITDLEVRVGEENKKLFSNFNLSLRLHDRVAIIGRNGIGKTSLFRVLMGNFLPAAGKIRWGVNVYRSYFEQEGRSLDGDNSVMEEFWKHNPRLTPFEVRSALGRVRISGEDVEKKVSMLSGGEKARLAFAIMGLERGNLLLLDEPTNHLDLPTKESLEEALSAFDGTTLLISHDRYFLRKIPTKIIELNENGYRVYVGNYDDYLAAKKREAELSSVTARPAEAPAKATDKSVIKNGKEQRVKMARLRNEKTALEEALSYLEKEEKELKEEIADPEIYKDYLQMGIRCRRLEEIAAESEEKMMRLVEVEMLLEEG